MILPFKDKLLQKRIEQRLSPMYLGEWIGNFVTEDEKESVKENFLKMENSRNVFHLPELYDLAYTGYSNDVEYYSDKTSEGAILYLGVGTGRIYNSLIRKNPNIFGIDNSTQMVDLLLKKYPELSKEKFFIGDVANINLPQNFFDVVIAPYSFFQLVKRDLLSKAFENIKTTLKDGGRIYMDCFSPFSIHQSQIEKSSKQHANGVKISYFLAYNDSNQTAREMAIIEEPNKEVQILHLDLEILYPDQIEQILLRAGYTEIEFFGGYSNEPFEAGVSELMVVNALKS